MGNGNVVAIYISSIAGEKMKEVETAAAIAGAGLAGDRYSTGEGSFNRKRQGRRQVSLINAIFFKDSGFEYIESRRNIVTQGVELMWLIGREFQIGEARFRGQKYCDPCLRPSRLSGKTQKFLEAFSDRGGLIAEIVESGTIKKGDLITLKALPEEAYYYRNREPEISGDLFGSEIARLKSAPSGFTTVMDTRQAIIALRYPKRFASVRRCRKQPCALATAWSVPYDVSSSVIFDLKASERSSMSLTAKPGCCIDSNNKTAQRA